MLRIASTASLLVGTLALAGCFIIPRAASPTADVDAAYTQRVAEARSAYQASHSGQDALVFAVTVETLYRAGTVERGKADGAALVAEAASYLDAAVAQAPADAPSFYAAKGSLYLGAGDRTTARAAFETAIVEHPTLTVVDPLLGIYADAGDTKALTALCKRTRAVANGDERFALLDMCFRHSHADRVEDGLAWAGHADIAYYQQAHAEAEAQAGARAADRQAQRDRAAQEAADRAAQAPTPRDDRPAAAPTTGPTTVSVTLRSGCSQTVRLFFGDNPRFGSGTRSSLSANTVTSYTKQPGEMIWLVDDHDAGLGSVTIRANTREIAVSCSTITAR